MMVSRLAIDSSAISLFPVKQSYMGFIPGLLNSLCGSSLAFGGRIEVMCARLVIIGTLTHTNRQPGP